jgi:hypothetical protein
VYTKIVLFHTTNWFYGPRYKGTPRFVPPFKISDILTSGLGLADFIKWMPTLKGSDRTTKSVWLFKVWQYISKKNHLEIALEHTLVLFIRTTKVTLKLSLPRHTILAMASGMGTSGIHTKIQLRSQTVKNES